MKIGSLEICGHAALAPMAGVADRAFRELCRSYGAAYTVTEMASAKALTLGDRKSAELLTVTDGERPTGIQIFGSDPAVMAQAVEKVLPFRPEFLDINMGCPAPKVAANAGARLMQDPALCERIVREVVKVSPVPVTVKLRAGWDDAHKNAVEVAKRCEQAGAAAIAVHGRTRQQMYAPPVDRAIIRAVKEAVGVPVIGNGDVTDGPSAAALLEETGCDMVLIGRGALGRPWVFQQVNAWLDHTAPLPEPPVAQRMAVMLKHIEKLCEYKGERIGLREARKHAAWYIRGLRGAAQYRARCGQISTMDDLRQIALELIAENQGE